MVFKDLSAFLYSCCISLRPNGVNEISENSPKFSKLFLLVSTTFLNTESPEFHIPVVHK